MTESEASLQAGARTIGTLRLLVLFAVSIVPATVGIILSVVISGDLYADISENLARFVHIFTNVFLIAYPIFWGISGADETRLMQAFLRNSELPPVHQQFVRLSFGFSVGFGIVLGLAIIAMIAVVVAPDQMIADLGIKLPVEPAWVYLVVVFLAYSAVDILSWLTRRWFLQHLISDSQSLSDYYLDRPHVRRLVLQCVCPAVLLGFAAFWHRTGTLPDVLAFGVFLASTIYSEAVIASWRNQMKKDLKPESRSLDAALDQMIARDRILKTALYAAFLISIGTLVIWLTNAMIQRFTDTVDVVYSLGDHTSGLLGPAALAIAFGAAAFLFKLRSRLLYGLMETLVGVIFIKHALPSPLPTGGLDIVKIFGSIFIFMRGLENSHGALPDTRVDLAATIDNFGQWRVFQ